MQGANSCKRLLDHIGSCAFWAKSQVVSVYRRPKIDSDALDLHSGFEVAKLEVVLAAEHPTDPSVPMAMIEDHPLLLITYRVNFASRHLGYERP